MIDFDLQTQDCDFTVDGIGTIEKWSRTGHRYGENWPVVYIIHNDKEAYVGETLNAGKRAQQHFQREDRRRLSVIHIITDDSFNKSVILDLESYLIKYMSADGKFRLQNGNGGLQSFDYYNREEYEKFFEKVWQYLMKIDVADNSIRQIENSDIYKYSPYKALTTDQSMAMEDILDMIRESITSGEERTMVVRGGAGTGKTIMAVFLMKLLADAMSGNNDNEDDQDENGLIEHFKGMAGSLDGLRIGFVVPMQSLRSTLKGVFKRVGGLSEKMVISPLDVMKGEPYDLLIVDEAHRLRQRKGLSQYGPFDQANEKLGIRDFDDGRAEANGTELDWIIKRSRMQLLFYDPMQSVKPSDIGANRIRSILEARDVKNYELRSQLRCLGGDDYIQYVKSVLLCESPLHHGKFGNYDLRFYDDIKAMTDDIIALNKKVGLCATVAGYSWKWVTKNDSKNRDAYDIDIDGNHYIWNRTDRDWINSDRWENEVGCIHTVQGYDLNYAGIIFGNEIRYNPLTQEIYIDRGSYQDNYGKAVGTKKAAQKDLHNYIINIYITLMTRGISGTFVYVCDKELREYLRGYFRGEG